MYVYDGHVTAQTYCEKLVIAAFFHQHHVRTENVRMMSAVKGK